LTLQIHTITTPFMFNVSVNCYLVKTSDGFILIDTGWTKRRAEIEREIENGGCSPGELKLILLTHGDFDHCGNTAYLRRKFGGQIAIHGDDSGMVENGDMFWNRNKPNFLIRSLTGLFSRLSEADRFKPDILLADGDDLSDKGFDARVFSLPGHSKGSVGFLTAEGDLFCGDLLANVNKPSLWSIIDDVGAAGVSVEVLKGLEIRTVYPGHGDPFPFEHFLENWA
jgi:hydroxyacylglutathione hydrolase